RCFLASPGTSLPNQAYNHRHLPSQLAALALVASLFSSSQAPEMQLRSQEALHLQSNSAQRLPGAMQKLSASHSRESLVSLQLMSSFMAMRWLHANHPNPSGSYLAKPQPELELSEKRGRNRFLPSSLIWEKRAPKGLSIPAMMI